MTIQNSKQTTVAYKKKGGGEGGATHLAKVKGALVRNEIAVCGEILLNVVGGLGGQMREERARVPAVLAHRTHGHGVARLHIALARVPKRWWRVQVRGAQRGAQCAEQQRRAPLHLLQRADFARHFWVFFFFSEEQQQ
jgi:hypothetical protein